MFISVSPWLKRLPCCALRRRLYDDTFALLQSFDSIPGGMGEPLTEKAVAIPGKAERQAYAAAH